MFLVHGFDNVTVARIAAACEVSEQTVFNYFPTKESMFFDRSESMTNAVADAVRERGSASLVEAVVQSLGGGIRPGRWGALDEAGQLHLFRLFCDVATGSPTLVAARFADLPRFIDEVSVALAQRIGADPIDPEVQLATLVIAGLVRVRLQSTFHHVQHATSLAALERRRPPRRPQGRPARRADPYRVRQHARNGEAARLRDTPFPPLGQDLDVPVGSVHADALPVADQPGGVLHAHDGRQAVLARDHRAVGHQAADLGHQALDRDEQRRPAGVGVGGDQDVARLRARPPPCRG